MSFADQTEPARVGSDAPTIRVGAPFCVQSGALPEGWPQFVRRLAPVRAKCGTAQALMRRLVGYTYPAGAYRRSGVSFDALDDDTRFAAASTLWRDVVFVTHQRVADAPALARRAQRMRGCHVAGYEVESPKDFLSCCRQPLCPYCHARRVAWAWCDLATAFDRRPLDAKLQLSAFYLRSITEKACNRVIHKKRPAAVVYFLYPIPGVDYTKGQAIWDVSGVFMTDRPSLVKDRRYLRPARSKYAISVALSRWLRYPREWVRIQTEFGLRTRPRDAALRMLHAFASLPPRKQLYKSLGACRGDYVQGKGWYDFAGHDPR